MTHPGSTVADPPAHDEDARGGNRRTALLVGLAVALVVLAVAGWHRLAVHRAEQVEVRWTADPDCHRARVVDRTADTPTPGDEVRPAPVIRAERGMRCLLTIEVVNGSGGTVHLDEALLPFMGPGGRAVLQVDTTTEPDVWEVPPENDTDLARTLDTELRPDEAVTFDVPIVFRGRGCSGGVNGGTSTMHGFPTVTVDYLLHSFERSAANDLVHTQAGPARGCDVHKG